MTYITIAIFRPALPHWRSAALLLAVLFAALWGLSGASARAEAEPSVLIRNVRIFDGTGAGARPGAVLIRGDKIVATGKTIRKPRGAKVVDGRGMTLIPGLTDLHTHMRSPAMDAPEDLGKAWAGYLINGVTGISDFSLSGEMIAPVRALASGQYQGETPRLALAVRLGVPGGHGTEYGRGRFYTLRANTPRAARQAMARALSYKPDLIKVFADGWRYGRDGDLNDMNEETLAEIVRIAHDNNIPVVTHTVTLRGAKRAARARVDALVHGIGDAPIDDELIALMQKSGTAYVPTMVVYEPQQKREFSAPEWQSFTPAQQANEIAYRASSEAKEPLMAYDTRRWAILKDNMRRLAGSAVTVGLGTDAGISGVYHGPSLIREMEWMNRLGFSAKKTLIAASAGNAQIMHQDERQGTITPGARADLVLVDGRPDEKISDLWRIARVWRAGREVPLAKLRARADSPNMSPMPAQIMAGPIYNGVRKDGRTDLDTLIVDGSEEGADHSHIDAVHQAGESEGKSPIFTLARFGASRRPFALLTMPLIKGGIGRADASAFDGIAFTARGTGNYKLMIDSYGTRYEHNHIAAFTASEQAGEVRLSFADFTGGASGKALQPENLRAIRFVLAGEPGGNDWLELSDVRFIRK